MSFSIETIQTTICNQLVGRMCQTKSTRAVLSLDHEIPSLPLLPKRCNGEGKVGMINLKPRRLRVIGHENCLQNTTRSSNATTVAESPFANVRLFDIDEFSFQTPKPASSLSSCAVSLGSHPTLPDLNLDMAPMPQRHIMLSPKKRKMPAESAYIRLPKMSKPTVTIPSLKDFVFQTPVISSSG